MRGRIRRAKVIHRLNNPSAEKITPHAIDGRLRKVRMRSDPLGEHQAQVPTFVFREDLSVQQSWRDLELSPRIEYLAAFVLDAKRYLLPGGIVVDHVRDVSQRRLLDDVDPPEEGSHAPELILAPGLERMVVALSAIQPASHEDAELFGHLGLRVLGVESEVVPRWAVVTLRREALPHHL